MSSVLYVKQIVCFTVFISIMLWWHSGFQPNAYLKPLYYIFLNAVLADGMSFAETFEASNLLWFKCIVQSINHSNRTISEWFVLGKKEFIFTLVVQTSIHVKQKKWEDFIFTFYWYFLLLFPLVVYLLRALLVLKRLKPWSTLLSWLNIMQLTPSHWFARIYPSRKMKSVRSMVLSIHLSYVTGSCPVGRWDRKSVV